MLVNGKNDVSGFGIVVLVLIVMACTGIAQASIIQTADIVPIPPKVTGSGNGTLDLRMFTFSGSEIWNASGSFNGDNGNNTLPHSGNYSFTESYVTTAGDLKTYYNLNYTSGSINEIMLLLDLNETGDGEPTNTLVKLDIVINPTSIQGSPDPSGDVLSNEQAAINNVYTGGTTIANLSPQPAANIPVNNQGAGFADYAIFTGIDPFSLNDSDVLLFNISMSDLDNGAEELFLSGTYAPGNIPEPATLLVMAAAGLPALLKRRRRQN
jgi:hypothetical protein